MENTNQNVNTETVESKVVGLGNNSTCQFVDEAAIESKNTDANNDVETMAKIEDLSKLVHMEAVKNDLASHMDTLHAENAKLMGTIKGLDSEKEFLDEKLKEYTSDSLAKHLRSDKNVLDFFINPDTGVTLEMNIPFESREREIEFKRGFLVYLKTTQEAFDKIDEQFDELDKYTAEMNADIKSACDVLSDNVLTYISYMKDKADAIEDEKTKKKMLESLRYIKSGYDLSIYAEVIEKHPSVASKCVSELQKEVDIQRVGARYAKKIESNGIKMSLVNFASDIQSGKKSFEELTLVKDEDYKLPDLLVYSLIRFFSMADWSDNNIKKAHASVSLVLKKLLNNEFEEDIKTQVVDSIRTYLSMFPTV